MKTTFFDNVLTTLTPQGLELITKQTGTVIGSTVYNGRTRIYHKINVYTPKNEVQDKEQQIKETHKAALTEFLQLAKGKDLKKPLN